MAQLQRITIAPHQLAAQQITLTSAQQHYLGRVLRLRGGDRLMAIDGQGQGWLAVLQIDLTTAVVLEAIEMPTELPISINLLMALPKQGLDEVIRQTTELGVGQILPILSSRALLKPSSQKLDRWQRIAQEAAEQSERQVVPAVLAPQDWPTALQTWNSANSQCYLCEPRGEYPHLLLCLLDSLRIAIEGKADTMRTSQPGRMETQTLELTPCLGSTQAEQNSVLSPQPSALSTPTLTIAIGPEGGWTATEIEQAIAAGYQPVSLGSRILRAVTAPVVALSIVTAALETDSQSITNR